MNAIALRLVSVLGVAALVVSNSGCSRRVAQLPLVSTRAPQYERLAGAPVVRDVTAYDSRTWFLFIPFGGSPSYQEALDEALASTQGDFMVNARLYSYWWSFLLFSYQEIRVVGDVGNSRGTGTLNAPLNAPPE